MKNMNEPRKKSQENWKDRKDSGNYLTHAGGAYHQHRMEACRSLVKTSDVQENDVLDFACG
jgi:hypothetical protein